MVDILLLQTVSIAIASAGILIAAVYYLLQIRHQTRMRQTDLVMRLYSDWGNEDLQKAVRTVVGLEFRDYDDYVKKYMPVSLLADGSAWIDIWKVGWFFNGIGVLLQSKLADVELVDKLFGYMILSIWEKLEPIIEGMRKQVPPTRRERRTLEWFEYLYNEMKKREQKLHRYSLGSLDYDRALGLGQHQRTGP
jgi:hypothetical protein